MPKDPARLVVGQKMSPIEFAPGHGAGPMKGSVESREGNVGLERFDAVVKPGKLPLPACWRAVIGAFNDAIVDHVKVAEKPF